MAAPFHVTKIKGIANEICRLHRYTAAGHKSGWLGGKSRKLNCSQVVLACNFLLIFHFARSAGKAKKKEWKSERKKMGSTGNAVRIEQTISLLICANWFERLKCAVIDTHPHTKPYTQTQILTRTPRQRGTNTNTRIQAIYMEINTNIFTMARTKNKKEG